MRVRVSVHSGIAADCASGAACVDCAQAGMASDVLPGRAANGEIVKRRGEQFVIEAELTARVHSPESVARQLHARAMARVEVPQLEWQGV